MTLEERLEMVIAGEDIQILRTKNVTNLHKKSFMDKFVQEKGTIK